MPRLGIQGVRARKLVGGAVVGAIVGLIAATIAWTRPVMVERGEFWTYDLRAQSAARPAGASDRIVLVEIDEQSIEDAENHWGVTWPWPRAMYGYLAEYFAAAGVRAIVFDWLFQDRGQYSVTDAEEFAAAMRSAGNVVIGLALTRRDLVDRGTEGPWVARLREFPSRAEAERAALALMAWNARSYLVGDGPTTVYYGGKGSAEDVTSLWTRLSTTAELETYFAVESPDGELLPPAPPEPRALAEGDLARPYRTQDIIAARDGMDIPGPAPPVPDLQGIDPPLAVIAAAPARAGNVYQDFEADGIMRRHTPLVRHEGRFYPSLALAAYLVANPEVEPRWGDGALLLGKTRLPLDGEGKAPIRFHGKDVYQAIPAYKILRSFVQVSEETAPEIPYQDLRDKYVIVSASGQALRDIRVTPVSKVQQGAEVQATALDNILQANPIRRIPAAADALIALLLCLGAGIAMVAIWTSIPNGSLALAATTAGTLSAIAGFWLLADWLYGSRGLWIAVAAPGGGAAVSAFAALLVTSASERRDRRFVQEALGRYTSPALVRELTEHPEYLSLEWGTQREMSVFFSDIAGFTGISEGLSPKDLVALLNDYLTNMTDLVLAHDGVVDKYIGDAVMAFWGAPLPDADHARKSVSCAIAMRNRCAELRPGWKERFGIDLVARAGINTGPTVVGNMGSKHKYNYTVMGDMVNLAARLEGANKPYGTELMISEFTMAAVGDAIDARELDFLTVKGREEPVRVYEVLDLRGATDPLLLRAVERFHDGLARYRERDFAAAITDFEDALAIHPGDQPSRIFIDRCKHFLDQPPPGSWDGVWRLKEK